MKIQELQAFLAVCKYGTFTKAAEKTFTTQPNISGHIRSLEKEIGQPLFIRGKGQQQITLTKAGQSFYPRAKQWVDLWTEFETSIADEQIDHYHFACTSSISGLILPPLHRYFRERLPQCELALYNRFSSTVFQAVEHGELNSGLCCEIHPSAQVNSIPFAQEKYVFLCKKEAYYPEQVQISELNPALQIYCYWTGEYDAWQKSCFGEHARPLVKAHSFATLPSLFSDRNAWMIAPYCTYLQYPELFRACELDYAPPQRIFYLVSELLPKQPHYDYLCSTLADILRNTEGMTLLVK